MKAPRASCSGLDTAGPEFDEEFRNILDALFCACPEGAQDTDTRLRRELFRLTEMEGQTPARAACALGLGILDAEGMLARTRRDIAVLTAFGLCIPVRQRPADAPRSRDCRCGNTALTQRHDPPMKPGPVSR
jgi:hypothetical protein